MRSIALFSYLLISSSIYLGDTPIGITINEDAEYNKILTENQLFIDYNIDSEVFNTNNAAKMNEEVLIGGDFVLLDALILMEIDEKMNAQAEGNMHLSDVELIEKFYNEAYYNTFEGAIISGNTKFLTDALNKNDLGQLQNVLDNYSNFFTYEAKSTVKNTMATIKTTPFKLALFIKKFNEEDLSFCNSSMLYFKKLITHKDEDYKSQEMYIVNESRPGSTYINIGYVNGLNANAVKMFVEVQESSKLQKIDNIRKDNYIVMNLSNEEADLGFFGE